MAEVEGREPMITSLRVHLFCTILFEIYLQHDHCHLTKGKAQKGRNYLAPGDVFNTLRIIEFGLIYPYFFVL
jgi:hypothetical protein